MKGKLKSFIQCQCIAGRALFISRLSLVEIITSFGGDIMEYLSHISRAGNFHFPHILYKQYKCSRRKPMELWSNQFCWWSQFTPHTPTFSGILNFSALLASQTPGRNKRPKVLFNLDLEKILYVKQMSPFTQTWRWENLLLRLMADNMIHNCTLLVVN